MPPNRRKQNITLSPVYSEEDMKNALTALRTRAMTAVEASKLYGISLAALNRNMKIQSDNGETVSVGRNLQQTKPLQASVTANTSQKLIQNKIGSENTTKIDSHVGVEEESDAESDISEISAKGNDEDKECTRCRRRFNCVDPHNFCKPCRQPDPQRFFCSDQRCGPCQTIRDFEALHRMLQKMELDRLSQKVARSQRHFSPASSVSSGTSRRASTEECKLTSEDLRGKKTFSPIFYDGKLSQISPAKLSGRHTPTTGGTKSNSKGDKFNYDVPNSSDLVETIESRLYNKIMNSLIRPTSPSVSTSLVSGDKPLQPDISPDCHNSSCDIEENFEPLLKSFFSKINPAIILSSKEDNNYTFKASSEASSLLQNTFLSSPSKMNSSMEGIYVKESDSWPIEIDDCESFYDDTYQVPSLKLHPKVRNMQSTLFGKFEPTLPTKICEEGFCLAPVTEEMKKKFFTARECVQRHLLLLSMIHHFDGYLRDKSPKSSVKCFLKIIEEQISKGLEKRANDFAIVIQEFRKKLLQNARCKERGAIRNLVRGPLHHSNFFGPYVEILQKIIDSKGKAYCITSKDPKLKMNIPQLPVKALSSFIKEKRSLRDLNLFFVLNNIPDIDKPIYFKYFVPKTIMNRLEGHIKPWAVSDYSFDELSDLFAWFTKDDPSLMKVRQCFQLRHQNKGESVFDYAEALEQLFEGCQYGSMSNEILRDKFVFGLRDLDLKDSLMEQPSLTYEESKRVCFKYACEKIVSKMEDDIANFKKGETQEVQKVEVSSDDGISEIKIEPAIKRKKQSQMQDKGAKKPKVSFENYYGDVQPLEPTRKYFSFFEGLQQLGYSESDEVINVDDCKVYKDKFGIDKEHTYTMYCPFTGFLIRN